MSGNIKCKICSAPVLKLTALNQTYYKCRNCSYIFKDISDIPGKKEEKERYLSHENSSDNPGYVKMFKDFLEYSVYPFSKPPGEALDYGCGYNPVLAEILTASGFNADIYDKYFFSEKPWKKEHKIYDLITSTEVFEHIRHPLLVINFLKKHLKPGGIIALMTLSPPADKNKFKDWWYLKDSTHISFYSRNTFNNIAEKTGLQILKTDGKKYCTLVKKEIQ